MTGMYLGIIHKAARTVHTGRLSMSINGFWYLAYVLHTCTQYVLNLYVILSMLSMYKCCIHAYADESNGSYQPFHKFVLPIDNHTTHVSRVLELMTLPSVSVLSVLCVPHCACPPILVC